MPEWQADDGRIVLVNADGEWSLWRSCTDLGNGCHVGPGYIGRYVDTGGRVLVDDSVHGMRTLNDPVSGGLGAFGLEVAQRNDAFPRRPVDYCWISPSVWTARP